MKKWVSFQTKNMVEEIRLPEKKQQLVHWQSKNGSKNGRWGSVVREI